jgi:hypothetical protein
VLTALFSFYPLGYVRNVAQTTVDVLTCLHALGDTASLLFARIFVVR